ncbi:hypothetical protein Mapa_000361 [Marchantia paleacea]|nr:hypothetical protein Mapa_000361 [Marchantia paleacea]
MNMLGESDEARNMDGLDEEEEDEDRSVVAIINLHSAPYPFQQKMNLSDLCRFSSAIAWCPRTNIVACATETCARDPGLTHQPAFWIPIHVVDPERPSEHAIFNVTAESPGDAVQTMEWSPLSCPQALLICNSSGRVTIWSQPTQGPPNVACTINCWSCEYEWQQEHAVAMHWLAGPSSYRWSPTVSTGGTSSKSYEERFLAHGPRPSARWPDILCTCAVFFSGSVQLRWRQWPPKNYGPVKWHATNKAVLGAGPSGVFCADAIITDSGSLHVAGAPVGHPSTLVVWEVSPWVVNPGGTNQQAAKYSMGVQSPLGFGPPSWPGVAPLAAYLLSWQEQAGNDVKVSQAQAQLENDEKAAPLLHCSPVSNLSGYVTPEASTLSTWGSGIAAIAFDPSRGGNALVTVICEGYFITPESPDDGPSMTGWRFQRWESTRQQVAIHPLFESQSASYPPPTSHPMITSWTAVSNKSMTPRGNYNPTLGSVLLGDPSKRRTEILVSRERPKNPRTIARITFANHGGEWALSLTTGEVMIYSGSSITPLETFVVRVGMLLPPSVAFSPTSCCVASVWHDKKGDCSLLKIWCLDPPTPASPQGGSAGSLTWERHIADRFWWSLVSEVDWWDIVACTQYVTESGTVTVARVAAVLDADFHALPNVLHRQHYGVALDQIKSRMLEGFDTADNRALVLDMQARLSLDALGKGIESALVSPATLVPEPWLASNEVLSGLGPDAMAVDTHLVPNVQAYVDSILDLASHFLTRLRRYASFCRTLATHGGANLNANAANRAGVNSSNGGPLSAQTGQGPGGQAGAGSNGTASTVQWLQGAVAKMNNTGDSTTGNPSSTGLSQAHAMGVGSVTFPGIPAVRLIGDCQFLHRLCQLLFFCLIFRKRQVPRHVSATSRMSGDVGAPGAKNVNGIVTKAEDSMTSGSTVTRSGSGAPFVKSEDGSARPPVVSKAEEAANARSARSGTGNAGQGYTAEEVKFLFFVLVDLCKRTSSHAHPMPKSQVGASNPVIRLHYVDGQYAVPPEVVEASLGPHMQQLPRPRGADAAGLLMKELELHAPAEEWNRRSMVFGAHNNAYQAEVMEMLEEDQHPVDFWPRKRRFAERDAAFGFNTAIGLGSFAGFMGSRRDVITGVWKTAQYGHWHKCMRCGRKTASLTPPDLNLTPSETIPTTREAWWTGRWRFKCPMCGGRWARML